MSNLPDDVKPTNPYWNNQDYNCKECDAPVEGEMIVKWLASLEPDEDNHVTADELSCWVCHCTQMGVCTECEGALNQDLVCSCIGCDKFGVEQ